MVEKETVTSQMNKNKSLQDKPRSDMSFSPYFTTPNEIRNRFGPAKYPENEHEPSENRINMRQYAQQLAPWVYNYRLWTAMSSFPSTIQMMSFLPFAGQQSFSTNGTPVFPQQAPAQTPQSHSQRQTLSRDHLNILGPEFLLPPLWKRVLAELIDFIVLFYLKIIIMIMVLRQMGILKTENVLNVHLDAVPYFDLKNMEMDIDKAFTMTSEIIALEVVNRIMITLFETFCLRQGIGAHGGATPGKRILGMCVVSCESIIDLGNNKVIVVPAGDIGFINALIRSVIKNFTMAFFFPACFTVFFFQHNRAAYDVLARTIVVEITQPNRR